VVNTKVVDLATSNLFYKSHIGFFCPDESYLNANFECQQVIANSEFWLAVDLQVFPLKIGNANLHESCVPHQDLQLS
jgi:hypothetical protein